MQVFSICFLLNTSITKTDLSSSAPVERLFSSGSLILSKRRNRLSDKLFETLLMLKINQQFKWRTDTNRLTDISYIYISVQ